MARVVPRSDIDLAPAGEMSERQAAILVVAEQVFAENGIRQSTVREIGARAGVLSGSLYYHFQSKFDIVDAILGPFCGEVLAAYRLIVEGHDDGIDRLQAMARYAFSLVGEHAASVLILQRDSVDLMGDPRFAYLTAFNDEIERHWLDALSDGIRQGRIRDNIEPALYYRFARDVILGATRWYDPHRERALEDIAAAFTRMLVLGITTPSGRGRITLDPT